MGLGPLDDGILDRIEEQHEKLSLQLQWFPCNNSRFFSHEPENKLAVDATEALQTWMAKARVPFDVSEASSFLSCR